jgi:response regulator of citrate/malate metabolism
MITQHEHSLSSCEKNSIMALSVLIVEDEFIIAEDLRHTLIHCGYEIFGIAYSYEQAITLLQKGRPDIVLLDITLDHEQSGLLLGKMLSHTLRIPYVYVTAHGDPGTMKDAEHTLPSGYLMKPFRREAIGNMIEVVYASSC